MSPKGRPKKNDNVTHIWVVEQYYHSKDSSQSWGKPLKICYNVADAVETIETESKIYASDFESSIIDRSIPRLITVKPEGEDSFYPSMDFWYYHTVLVDDDEEEV